MEALLRLSRRATYADYLAVEQCSEYPHEFFDGVIVAKAGGSDEQHAISGRLAHVLGSRVTGNRRYYASGQRFWIPSRTKARYTDGSIICGAPEHPAHDNRATMNPEIAVEVLSPSSEGDDDGDKRADFQSLRSLEAYVLVAQDQWRVKVYRRVAGEWRVASYRDGDSFELSTLLTAISVAEIYSGILDVSGRSMLR